MSSKEETMKLRFNKKPCFLMLVLCLVFTQYLMAQGPAAGHDIRLQAYPPAIQMALGGISIRDLKARVGFLSSDLLEGRDTPGRGLDIAAAYLTAEFQRMGLEPGGPGGTYLQTYFIREYESTHQNTEVSLVQDEKKVILTPDERSLLLFGLTGQRPDVSAPIVFAGFGITAPEKNWDDYKQVDVRGKTVLVFAGAPWETDLDVVFGYDKLFGKLINAKAHGAVGFIYASPSFGQEEPLSEAFVRAAAHGHNMILPLDTQEPGMSIPAILTSWDVVDQILGMSRVKFQSAQKLAEKINASKKPVTFEIPGLRFQVDIRAEMIDKPASNVIGLIRGADEQLRDEFVVFSAHYDHLGISTPVEGDSICNGADDNASGTAAILELAEAFTSLPEDKRPRRSLLFLLVSGEEKGLYGSAYFSEHPTVPLSQVVANINIDMIGRSDSSRVQVIAPGAESLYKTVLSVNEQIGLNVLPDQQPQMRLIFLSDQYQFVRNDIPAVFFFTGLHPDYHQPSDEFDKVNFIDFEKITQLIFLTGLDVANSDESPEWSRPEILIIP
jgi:hypothetical protein